MKLSVVIPARNEAESIAVTVRGVVADAAPGSTTRCSWSTTGAPMAPRRWWRRWGGAGPVSCFSSPYHGGFGLTVRAGRALRRGRRGDRDGGPLRRPPGSRPLLPRARGGLRLRFRLALHTRLCRPRLSASEARDQPGRQLGHPVAVSPRLQRHDERLQGLPARSDRWGPAAARTTST